MNSLKKLLLAFLILEVIFALFLAYTSNSNKTVCLPGFECNAVQNSPYAYFLGFKLTTLGAIAFPALLILFLTSVKYEKLEPLYLLATILGALGAIYFLFIQAFVLYKFCSSCVAIDGLMIVIFIFTILDYKPKN